MNLIKKPTTKFVVGNIITGHVLSEHQIEYFAESVLEERPTLSEMGYHVWSKEKWEELSCV